MITFYQLMRIVEIRTKLISISGFGIGAVYSWYRSGSLDPVVFLVMLGGVLAVDMATTGFNTFFDFFHGVDRRDLNRESDKVLVHQGVPAGTALLVSLVLYALAVVLGIVLALITTPWVIPIGALSMAIGFLYNAGPLPLSRTPLGELFAGGFLGWVLVTLTVFVFRQGAGAVAAGAHVAGAAGAGAMAPQDLLAGIPSMLMVASILTVNNTCDIDGDRKAGRKTLSILLGRRAGEVLVYLLGGGTFVLTGLYGYTGILPRTILFGTIPAALLSIPVYVGMHRRGYSHETKGPSMGAVSKVFLLFTLGYVLPTVYSALAGR
jgi:1,4-dihydroxy-2-naphthoate polyprenyltransferase